VKPEAYESALGSGMTAVLLADGTGLETFRGPIIGKEVAAILLRYKERTIDLHFLSANKAIAAHPEQLGTWCLNMRRLYRS
jgi:hypothetical protein